jgi:hypothetical protein
MRILWWLFWLIPISMQFFAFSLTTKRPYRGKSRLLARSALLLAALSPLMGVFGLLEIQVLQTRDEGNLVFEGMGLWVAVFGLLGCIVWLIADRRTRTPSVWIGLVSTLWTVGVWGLIVAAI